MDQRFFIIFVKSKYIIGMNLYKHEPELQVGSTLIPESVVVKETSGIVSVLGIFSTCVGSVMIYLAVIVVKDVIPSKVTGSSFS